MAGLGPAIHDLQAQQRQVVGRGLTHDHNIPGNSNTLSCLFSPRKSWTRSVLLLVVALGETS
jgi:hypothetical protein